ncbi:MAG TPA: A/G-specific adenine glycosylase [Terrimicrobiaceae bacterium]|nr:A/G-specific adenine glycosylase [Terrimicrobiaceae bacterium]
MAFSGTGGINKAQARRDKEEKIRRNLHRWFKRHRRELPWRQTRDPYAVMVSEFMLQQTTVAAVLPYFERWMAKFPTLQTLAQAPPEDVLLLWQGLGYYTRARNLHRAAKLMMETGGGKVPHTTEALRDLPGVGLYTAAAIMAFAFDAPVPVIDANVARVLARMRNWRKPVDDAAGRAFLRDAAGKLLPKTNGRLHNSALMELGALICVARNPRCQECPVRGDCRAQAPELLPAKRPRARVEAVSESRAFILEQGKLWLEPSPGPRWHGLWLLPHSESPKSPPDHVETYSITRFRVTMGVHAEPRRGPPLRGFLPRALPPMPSPHRRAVAAMLTRVHTAA